MVLRSQLEKRHPAFLFAYFSMAIILTMGCRHIGLLFVMFAGAFCYECVLRGVAKALRNLKWICILILVVTIGNGLLSHNGVSALFYINGLPITVEAFAFGAYLGLLLATAILWFDAFQLLCDSEKILYLFGKIAPSFGLIISMTLHYIPMLRERLSIIKQAQAGMGRGTQSGAIARVRQTGKEYSILISWSLENAIDTSDYMNARGYGNRRRSLFHRYYWKQADTILLLVSILLFIAGFVATYADAYHSYFYPYIYFAPMKGAFVWLFLAEIMFAFLPCFLELESRYVKS